MGGIAGFSGNFNKIFLEKANAIQAHRGPDDSGKWYDYNFKVGLAHRRLSVIDLSAKGHQPMFNRSKTISLVYNGEIYNYRELKKELLDKGYKFYSQSDSEVLIYLYEAYGHSMLSKLNGIFAFALWDEKIQELFLARDGLGVKPLYYSQNSNGFIFASEIKALLKEPSLNKDLSHEAIHYYISYLWCPSPHTILKNVLKLNPGHALRIKNGDIFKKFEFYDIPYNGTYSYESEADIAEELSKKVKEAVTRQMMSDVPVGTFLSGGLDSSAVSFFAHQQTKQNKLDCFTIGFKNSTNEFDGFVEDLSYAEKVASKFNLNLNTVTVGSDMISRMRDMIYFLDEPQADPASLNALFLCELAKEKGIKVLLSGAGGDDIFSGYRRHTALNNEKYWNWMPRPGRSLLKLMTHNINQRTTFGRKIKKTFNYADLKQNERIASYFLWMDEATQKELYSYDMKTKLEKISALKPLSNSLKNLNNKEHLLNKMLYLETKHFLPDHNLNYTDKMAMACGIEVRVPLLDKELVEFAAQIPPEMKQKNSISKYIFKKAMEPYLEKDIIYRPNNGFGAPLRKWLHQDLKDVVEDLLSKKSIKNRGLFNTTCVHDMIINDKLGNIDASNTIFSLMCIEWWQRIFIDESC